MLFRCYLAVLSLIALASAAALPIADPEFAVRDSSSNRDWRREPEEQNRDWRRDSNGNRDWRRDSSGNRDWRRDSSGNRDWRRDSSSNRDW